MTITLTVEELRTFEIKVNAWHASGNGAWIRVVADAVEKLQWPVAQDDLRCALRRANEARDKFERENPKPRLIPSI